MMCSASRLFVCFLLAYLLSENPQAPYVIGRVVEMGLSSAAGTKWQKDLKNLAPLTNNPWETRSSRGRGIRS